ncbi:hypothetical protein SY88_14495 [Clostridiales bacterium PH28_bin88]|nr:hypothetical protein SY88_14495 [Clostridiales bacterium PH28_bin88]
MMWGPYGWGGTGLWGWVWMLINGLIWIGIVVGIVVLIARLVQQPGGGRRPDSPLDILKRRYAAGEITREEFARMKDELGE